MKNEPFNRRALKALTYAGYSGSTEGALAKLADFAARNSGIEWRNYFSDARDLDGMLNYRRECRQIARDWQEFNRVLREANLDGVKDVDVINAAPRAFSGRLSWNQDHWDYCTGQYYCTEYRRAAIAVLDQAIRTVRQARPPRHEQVRTISDLKDLNARNGGCWFSRDSVRFFGTRIESGIIGGRYFITSEQPPHGDRKFSVRSFDSTGMIDTVGEFCGYATKGAAREAVPGSSDQQTQK